MTPTVRPLTSAERDALAAARLIALNQAPYLATALFAMRPLAAEGLGTFAVDRSWRLYIDPATLAEWGPQTSGGVLIHEAGHLIRDHAGRARALGNVDHERWNYATDAAINDDLLDSGIGLPEGVVTPAALGLEPGGIEEVYYRAIAPQPPQTEVGCGSGAGDPTQAWEPSEGDAAAPGLDAGQIEITRRRVAEDVRTASCGQGRGTVPAGMRRWAEAMLSRPPLPWRKVLANMVRHAAALTTGRTTYTYTRPGRRRLPRIVLPAMRAPRVTAAVVVDTSASMSPADLSAALHEVEGVIKAVGGGVQVLTCDAETSDVQTVRTAREVTLTGGGGTDMRVGIDAAEHAPQRPDLVVVLTDGYTPWPDQPTSARLIAVIVGENGPVEHVPTWARVLTVPAAA